MAIIGKRGSIISTIDNDNGNVISVIYNIVSIIAIIDNGDKSVIVIAIIDNGYNKKRYRHYR